MTEEEYLERVKLLRPRSGKRPEELNQSRDVNFPLQLARGWAAGLLGLPGDLEGVGRLLINIAPAGQEHARVTGKEFVGETPVLPTSDFYREYLPGYDERPAARTLSGAGALTAGMGATKAVRGVERAANVAVPAVARRFTDVPLTIEAVSPVLGQKGSRAFKEGITQELIGPGGAYDLGTMAGRQTSQMPGQGVYRNVSGRLETNPMEVVYVPGVRDISKSPRLLEDVASAGQALEQEAMAGVRFLPMATNRLEDASAMLIKPKKGQLSPEEIVALSDRLGSSMVVSHNPRLGGVVVVPFGEVKQGVVPSEFLQARTAANEILGDKAKVQYGAADINKDRMFMERPDYASHRARAATPDFEKYRDEMKYLESRLFGSGPEGGIQSWSRGPAYPTTVIGRGEGWQPANLATEEYGRVFPTFRQADEARDVMLQDWHRSLPGKVRDKMR